MLDPSLCPSCFGSLAPALPCRQCGFDRNRPAKPDVLRHGTTLAGRYSVGGLLGQGGFGATYRGYDNRLASIVAIKEYFPLGNAMREGGGVAVLVPNSAEETFAFGRSKFLEEARTLAKLRSIQSVVSVFDFFEENNTAYIIMEFLSGLTLKQFQARQAEKKLTPKVALPIFVDVLSALVDIHNNNILHRDISPDNILMDAKGGVKLLDFGAARQALSTKDQRMTVILKPGYAPLEQYSDVSNHGPWSDIYAAGATLYMLLSGQKPVDALSRLMNDTLQPLSAMGVKISPRVEQAIMKSLAIQPKERWQNAADFAKELEAGAASTQHRPARVAEGPGSGGTGADATTVSAPVAPNDGNVKAAAVRPHGINFDDRIGQPISTVELRKFLEEHARFLSGRPNGRRLNLSMRSISGLKLGPLNLSGAELTGTNLARCDLVGANFTNANLFCADLTGARLNNAKFIKTDLRGARFDDAQLEGVSFEGADCREGIMLVQRKDGHLRDVKDDSVKRAASFNNAAMNGAVLRNANLISARFENSSLENADFGGADLRNAHMGGAVLKNAKFEKANLFDCDFTHANLQGVDTSADEFKGAKIVRHLDEIEETLKQKIIEHQKWVESLSHSGKRLVIKNGDLSGLQMAQVDWSAAELLSVNMTDINLEKAKISMTDFSGSVLDGGSLFGVDARGAKFRACNIKNANFIGATLSPVISAQGQRWCATFARSDLRGSNFDSAECDGVDFQGADLRQCRFRNAALQRANFTGANVEGADFTDAVLDGVSGLKSPV